ncbi:MAG: class I SAM-dependent methyltransferase [Candidatus Omnitrophica bacterium]|nr:class I SAM-dependent methyltransferase [Candidatus Omnitrophota bacterium]
MGISACPLCNSEQVRPGVFLLGRFQVNRCADCRSYFIDPRVWGSLAPHSWPGELAEERAAYYEKHFRSFRLRTYDRALDHLEALAPKGRLLDVGAGYGTFLTRALERGWEAQGVESDAEVVRWVEEKQGLPLEQGDFLSADWSQGPYRVITLWDVLEHLPDPRAAVLRARELLEPGGMLVLRTPICNALLPGLYRMLYHITNSRVTAPLDKLFEFHLWHFDSRAIDGVLENSGFAIRRFYREPWVNGRTLHLKSWARSLPLRLGVYGALFLSQVCRQHDEGVWIATR